MRTARILGTNPVNLFHVVSRVIERRFILETEEREYLFNLIHAQEAFSGVRVLTWALMSDHFHLLLAVDDEEGEKIKETLSDQQILDRASHIYSDEALSEIQFWFEQLREQGGKKAYQKYRQSFLDRMFDLSSFVGEIKQRFSQWYNKREQRKGPLWEDRFKSVLLEGKGGEDLVWVVGAYIDLNAIRAGIVEDPGDYRHCGYGAAVGGDKQARKRLAEMLNMVGERWGKVHQAYRMILMERGVETLDEEGKVKSRGIKWQKLNQERGRAYNMSIGELLRKRIRYFSDGVVLGGNEFVEDVFERNRKRMGVKRKVGARKPKELALGEVRALVDLRGES